MGQEQSSRISETCFQSSVWCCSILECPRNDSTSLLSSSQSPCKMCQARLWNQAIWKIKKSIQVKEHKASWVNPDSRYEQNLKNVKHSSSSSICSDTVDLVLSESRLLLSLESCSVVPALALSLRNSSTSVILFNSSISFSTSSAVMIDGEAGSGIVEREREQAYWLRGFLETPLDLRSRRLWSSVWTFTWG